MKVTYDDKTDMIIWWRDFLQTALNENRPLKAVVAELNQVIAYRQKGGGQ